MIRKSIMRISVEMVISVSTGPFFAIVVAATPAEDWVVTDPVDGKDAAV